MSTLARNPERSSPFQLQALGGGAGQVVGQRRHLEYVVVLDRVGLGHHAPEPGLGLLVVRAVHEQHVVEQEARRSPSRGRRPLRTSALASSGIEAPLP